ncbi:MAG: 5'-nucleotidase C-terminal domain-containing protein, partial [Bacteroidales bacterium]|nr:5'-nucleotidase C-terminal domain-containing protein [Bacteroidales bacterium]
GHSHSKIDSLLIVNGVLISQAASHLNFLGEITIEFKDGKIEKKSSKLIALNNEGDVNTELKELVGKYKQNPMFNERIGRASEDLKGKEELGSFFTDAMRTEANLDIAFQNSGGLRIDELPKGEIKMGQIFKLDPFGNYLMVLNMNVNEIKSLIRSAFIGEGIDLRVSGIHYTLTTENGKINNIHITDYQGKELDKDKLYKVGMNDFILSFYKFEHKDQGQSFGVTTAEILISYIKKKRSINYKGVRRTFLKKN